MYKELQKHIDRVVGTKGTLRIPSWWMHKILSNLVKYCEENEGASVTIKKLIDELTTEVDKKLESEVVASTEPTEDMQLGYDDTEIREELAELSEKVENINPTPMVSVTYAELKALRDNGELVAGMQYRITDYVTTTAQENTQSAGHQFDVIVTADNENTLNEVARACLHEGDTYFSEAGANLSAWQIWYSLDNDSERFAWADTENGKGVIYRMIDEWNNDCPYDFKNIMFVRYELEAPEEYIAEGNDSLWMQQLCNNVRVMFDEGVRSFVWAGIADEDKYWEDEISQIISHTTGENFAFFTFNTDEDTDASLSGGIHGNKMQLSQTLPNNVFFGYDCYCNTFGNNCNSNTFGNSCYCNSFGYDCYSNSFGNYCYCNSFGNECYYNSFGNECYYNSFGNSCYYNSFGNRCNSNTFGNSYNSNSFGNNCNSNTFGNSCYYNSFGNSYNSNSFGNYCYSNIFVDDSDRPAHDIKYCRYDDGVHDVRMYYDDLPDAYGSIMNIHIYRGVHNVMYTPTAEIEVEQSFCCNYDGEIVPFILVDIITKVNDL